MKTRFKHWEWKGLIPVWLTVALLTGIAMHFTNEHRRYESTRMCNQTIIAEWCKR